MIMMTIVIGWLKGWCLMMNSLDVKFKKTANQIGQHLLGRVKLDKFECDADAVEHVAADVKEIVEAVSLLAAKVADDLEMGILVGELQAQAFDMVAELLAELRRT